VSNILTDVVIITKQVFTPIVELIEEFKAILATHIDISCCGSATQAGLLRLDINFTRTAGSIFL
jgi:hypothetical protein